MRIALAQLDPTVGDFDGNRQKILNAYRAAVEQKVDLVVTPELSVCGYPPLDLTFRSSFVELNRKSVELLASQVGAAGLIVGFIDVDQNQRRFNAVALLQHGRILAVRHKELLSADPFLDERKYFVVGKRNEPLSFMNKRLAVMIGDGLWSEIEQPAVCAWSRHPAALSQMQADIFILVAASPWYLGKDRTRLSLLEQLVEQLGGPLLFCNQVGGNDELIFDGRSMALMPGYGLVAMAKGFEEELIVVDLENPRSVSLHHDAQPEEDLFRALVLGTRDFITKCGFRSAIVGLSGGIDSALVACIGAEALGAENLLTVSLPSIYSSPSSIKDARQLAINLGVRHLEISIQPAFELIKQTLHPIFGDLPEDVTEENLQARIRAVYLMAISNKFGCMLLGTGNKSEVATGYCTLYGDMCGGLDVLGDVPKTFVYRIASWLNREVEIIPRAILIKPPSAELRPNQTDQDTLPPYEVLDQILEAYLEEKRSAQELVDLGFEPSLVRQTIQLIERSEFKRHQAAPILKVTKTPIGLGRRVPIANRFRELLD